MSSGKPKILVGNSVTGECREYIADNEIDLDRSIECIDGHFKWLERAKKNQNKARHAEHIRLMQAKTVEYVGAEGFQGSYSAVFLLMLGTAKYGGRIPLTKVQIGEKLKYSRQTVSRAITHLIQNGMVITGAHEGREYYFLPSPAAQKGVNELTGTKEVVKSVKFDLIQGGKA